MNDQCEVARRPSSNPAAASTKAPVQMETIRAPGRIVARTSSSSGESVPCRRGPGICVPGTITVSAAATHSGPACGTIA